MKNSAKIDGVNSRFSRKKYFFGFLLCLAAIIHGIVVRADSIAGVPGGYVSVFVACLAPILSPLIVLRSLFIPYHLESYFSIPVLKAFLVPKHAFPHGDYVAPDYSNEDENWAALPWLWDTADLIPPKCGAVNCENVPDKDEVAIDVFYVSPTTFYDPRHWNQHDLTDKLSNYIQDEAILPQQAAAFNNVARIYSPRYRQMTGFGYFAEGEYANHRISASDLAYNDVKASFEHYLKHWNKGRPFILASHSQGSEHVLRVLKHVIAPNENLKAKMVAAYVIGMPVYIPLLNDWGLKSCESKNETSCVISWQSYIKGTDPSLFYFQPSSPELRRPFPEANQLCTNPLDWLESENYNPKESNLGSMHPIQWYQNLYFLMGPDEGTLREKQNHRITNSLLGLSPNLVGAQCQSGVLIVDSPPFSELDSSPLYSFFPVWYTATFPAGNLHPMDYNFFWMNIRQNARDRARAYLTMLS